MGYSDRIHRGVGVVTQPTFLIRERYAVDSATIGTGRPPLVLQPPFARDTIPTLIDRPDNNLELRSSGIEITAILPEIKPLRTRLAIVGAWSKSRLQSSGVEFGTTFSDFQLSAAQPRAPYWDGSVRTGDRVLLTTRIIHHQPGASTWRGPTRWPLPGTSPAVDGWCRCPWSGAGTPSSPTSASLGSASSPSRKRVR